MLKYRKLAEEERALVIDLRGSVEELARCHEVFREETNGYIPEGRQLTYSYSELAEEERALQIEIEELERYIESEYDDTPFQRTREAGISGFWREVGGRLR